MICHFFLSLGFNRNAETWLQEQRRRLHWLRAKSIELGLSSPNSQTELLDGDRHPVSSTLNGSSASKAKERRNKSVATRPTEKQ